MEEDWYMVATSASQLRKARGEIGGGIECPLRSEHPATVMSYGRNLPYSAMIRMMSSQIIDSK